MYRRLDRAACLVFQAPVVEGSFRALSSVLWGLGFRAWGFGVTFGLFEG